MVERGLQDCATLALYSLEHFISTDFANQYKQGCSARFDDCRGIFHPLIVNANIAQSATGGPRRGAHGGTRKGHNKKSDQSAYPKTFPRQPLPQWY